jgi:hypothetical protein
VAVVRAGKTSRWLTLKYLPDALEIITVIAMTLPHESPSIGVFGRLQAAWSGTVLALDRQKGEK